MIRELKLILKTKEFWIIAALIIISYFPVFYRLDSRNLEMWDESIHAVHALEMAQNGDYLVKYADGIPLNNNLKPPIVTWIQVLCMKTIGYNELSIRLHSALSALILIILIIWFFSKVIKRPFAGYFSVLILITTNGYIHYHVTRTGEYDSTLSLFLFLSVLYYYNYIISGNARDFLITGIFTALAVLTKGIAGFLFLPAFFLYALIKNRIGELLRSGYFYFTIAISVILILSYYFARNIVDPGYLQRVLDYDVFNRYFDTVEEHKYGFWYYFKNIHDWQFKPWVYLFPVSIIIMFLKNRPSDQFFIFILLVSITFLIIISFGGTKLIWYVAPALPLMAIISALTLERIYIFITQKLKRSMYSMVIFVILSVLVFYDPYRKVLRKVSNIKSEWVPIKYGPFMKTVSKKNPDIRSYKVFYDGWNTHILYYKNLFNYQYGYNIEFENIGGNPKYLREKIDKLVEGDFVMMNQESLILYVKEKYKTEVVNSYDEIKLFRINSLGTETDKRLPG